MPSHKIHRLFSKLIFGKDGKEIHRAIDSGYKIYKSRHRNYPPHDIFSAFTIGAESDKEDRFRGVANAAGHILLDYWGSKLKKELRKFFK
jgi:hypothetical protein